MEIINEQEETQLKDWEKSQRRGKVFGGVLIIGAGVLFLARELGADIPFWILSWKMFILALGITIFVKKPFRFGGIIITLIGLGLLMGDILPEFHISKYVILGVALIIIGLFSIFKPHRNNHINKWHKMRYSTRQKWDESHTKWTNSSSDNSFLEINSVFGGVKKNIISKDFKGGEINAVFGGSEINLSQADISGPVKLEVNAVFGGVKLIIPSNWEINQGEITAVLGSVEDKRPLHLNTNNDSSKVLILTGDVVFGGVQIHSY